MSNDYNLMFEGIVFGISVVVALIVLFTSVSDKPPVYHWVFAYFGFIISVAWIYALANEVVDLLTAIGIIFNLSHLLLGLTVLAWGNSVGGMTHNIDNTFLKYILSSDFISNISMARNGFPRMGISACFGGPVLSNILTNHLI